MWWPLTFANPNESCVHWKYCSLTYSTFHKLSDESVDRTTTESSPLWGYSPPPPPLVTSTALAHTKEDTLLLPYRVKHYQLLLVSFQGWEDQVSYPGSVSASRKMKAMHSWHHQNYMDLKTLKCWGLRGAGSQMFLKKVRPKVIL